jgi:hypothetical protein
MPAMPTIILPRLPAAEDAAQPARRPSLLSTQTNPSLVQAIEALRLGDERFWGIRAEVRRDGVYLRGVVYRWEHLFELARAIARLPGVKQVLFKDVRAESP